MPKNQQRKVKQHQEAKANVGGHLVKQNMHEIEGEASSRGNPRANRSTGVSYYKPTRENLKLIASGLNVNQPTLPHGLGSNLVTPPKILKRQLTGYCTSLAASPMGRDNKHGWYEKHEKLVAIAAGSLSSVLLIGDSLVKGLARYHRVWSKYFKPLRALNFGVGGDRTQNVLWRIENGEIPLNLQVAFVHCGTNNLDRDNPDEIRDGIASIVYTIQERKPNANFIVSGLLPRDQETSFRRDKIKLVNQKLRKWCQSGKVRNVHYLKPDKDWTEPDGRLVERCYFTDFLHLVEEGYDKFAKSIYEAIEKGNVVTTVPPKPKPTATLPPPTAIAPKLKTPPTVTSTLIPTIPPTTTSPLIMTTQPTATLPLTPTIPPTTTSPLIMTTQPTATLPLTPTIPPTVPLPTVPLTKQLNTAVTNTKNTNTTNTSSITSTTGTNMTCTDLNTNTCTDTSTDLRSKTQKNQFYNLYFFVSILSLVRTLFLILRDLKIMNGILVFITVF